MIPTKLIVPSDVISGDDAKLLPVAGVSAFSRIDAPNADGETAIVAENRNAKNNCDFISLLRFLPLIQPV